MPSAENTAAPKKRKEQVAAPPVPESTRRIIRAGVLFALLCAAAMSAPTLFNLAELVGFKRNLAWLLPACLDGYAGTSILFGSKVPAGHPARKAATKNARLALALTVFANGGFHLLTLAGSAIPHWVSTTLLVTVSSLPPFIVHRLLHLHALADGNGATETATPVAARAATSNEKPTTVAAPATATAPQVAPKPAATPAPVAARNDNPGSGNPVTTLIPRPQQLQIVRELVATHGRDVALAEIQSRVGGHKSTASRLRAAVLDELDAEPERVREVS